MILKKFIRNLIQLFLWEYLNPKILSRKKKKLFKFQDSNRGINIGCGLDNPDQWIGIDGGITHYIVKKFPKFLSRRFFRSFSMSKNYNFDEYYPKIQKNSFLHFDLIYGIPYPDESVPNIYSSHFFEHIKREEAISLIKECYRVLKPGGVIRINVPAIDDQIIELENALTEYNTGNFELIQKFVTNNISGFIGPYSNHQYMYNFKSMSKLLENAGFHSVIERHFGEGSIPDVENLDTRPGLFVEAIKK